MKKKWIIVIIALLILVSMGIGVYFGFKQSVLLLNQQPSNKNKFPLEGESGNKKSNTPNDSNQQNNGDTYEKDQQKRLKKISTSELIGHWERVLTSTTSTTTEIGGIDKKGRVVIITSDGEKIVNETRFNSDPESIRVGASGKKLAVKFKDSSWAWMPTDSKIWNKIETPGVIDVSFSPDEEQLAYITYDKTLKLFVKDIGKQKKKETTLVVSLALLDRTLQWWTKDKIILSPTPSAYVSDSIVVVDIKNKTINEVVSGFGLQIKVNQNTGDAIISESTQQGKITKLSKITQTGRVGEIGLITVASKCSFNNEDDDLICSAPYEMSQKNTRWPDDILKHAIAEKDKIYKIQKTDQSIGVLLDNEEIVLDVIMIRKIGNNLYFINRYDDRLYQYSLE